MSFTFNTLDTVRKEAAGYSGRKVLVSYGDGYAVGPLPNGELLLTIPHGTTLLDNEFSTGVFHESMHLRFTDMHAMKGSIQKLFEVSGISPEKSALYAGDFHLFANAIEDIRIERKGCSKFPGANEMLQEVYERLLYERYIMNPFAGTPPKKRFVDLIITLSNGYVTTDHDAAKEIVRSVFSDKWGGINSKCIRSRHKFFVEAGQRLAETGTTLEGLRVGIELFFPPFLKLLETRDEIENRALHDAMGKLVEALEGGGQEFMAEGSEPGKKTIEETSGLVGVSKRPSFGWSDLFRRSAPTKGDEITLHATAQEYLKKLWPLIGEIRAWQEDSQYEGGHKRGRIDSQTLHRVALGSDKVFTQRRQQNFNDDIAYSFAIDVSGSMGHGRGSALMAALGSGIALVTALEAIGRDTAITTFDAKSHLIKEHGVKYSNQEIIRRCLENTGGGTNILKGYNTALKELKGLKEKHRVLFFITDGDVSAEDLEEIRDTCGDVFIFFISIGKDVHERIKEAFKTKQFSYKTVQGNDIASLPNCIIDFTKKLMTDV